MSDEAAFLRAIADAPHDDAPRLVFADWLDDRGDARAAWVRDPVVWRWMRPDAGDPLPRLVEQLGVSGTYRAVSAAFVRLGAVGVPALRAVADAGDESVRRHALGILGTLRPVEVLLPDALARLASLDAGVRRSALPLVEALESVAVPTLPRLLTMLTDPDWGVVLAAVHAIGRLGEGAGSAVPDLVALVDRADRMAESGTARNVRHEVLRALGQLGAASAEAIPLLMDSLDLGGDVAEAAGDVIPRLGPGVADLVLRECHRVTHKEIWAVSNLLLPLMPDVLPTMLRTLHDPEASWNARAVVVQALADFRDNARIDPPEVVAALRVALADPFLIDNASDVLGRMGDVARSAVPELLTALAKLIESGSLACCPAMALVRSGEHDAALRVAARFVAHADSRCRGSAFHAIARLTRAAGATSLLALGLADPQQQVRSRTARAIGDIEVIPLELSEPLRRCLHDPESYVRRAAVVALGRIGCPARDLIAHLAPAFDDLHVDVRSSAARVLGQLDWFDPAVLRAVRLVLASPTRFDLLRAADESKPLPDELGVDVANLLFTDDRSTRREAARSLCRLTTLRPEVFAAVRRALPDPSIRESLANFLHRFGPAVHEAIPEMLAAIDGDLGWRIVDALGAIGEATVPELRRLIVSNARVRGVAVRALASIGPIAVIAALPEIAACLRDEERWTRERALEALITVVPTTPAALPPLVSVLRTGDAQDRQTTLRMLRELGTAARPAFGEIATRLTDEEPKVRMEAARTLAKIGVAADEVVPQLRRAVHDFEPEVVRTVVASLAAFGPSAIDAVPDLLAHRGDADLQEAVIAALRAIRPEALEDTP